MKQFITFLVFSLLLITANSCGVSKQTYNDPVYESLVLAKDGEKHNYLPFEYESHTIAQQVVVRAYIEHGVLYFHINQSSIGKLVAHYKHIAYKVDSTLTFSGGYVTAYNRYVKNYMTSYNCSITDKALKRLSEDCFSLELNGANLGNTKGFRQFCHNVYEAYHPVYLDNISQTKKLIDVYNTETEKFLGQKSEMTDRIVRLDDELVRANNKYNLEYTKVKEQVKDSVKKYWLNLFFEEHNKSRFSYVSKIVGNVEYALTRPNSAGGCDFIFHATNKSDKTVKYAYITVRFKNAVDDFVSDDIRGWRTYTAKETGPIAHNQIIGGGGVWENAIYNNTAREPIISGVTIEYMDKSKVVLSGADMDMMFDFNVLYDVISDEQKKADKLIPSRGDIVQLQEEVTRLENELTNAKNDLYYLNQKIENNLSRVERLIEDMNKQSRFSTVS